MNYYSNVLGFSEMLYAHIYAQLKCKKDEYKTSIYNFNMFRVLLEEILSSIIDAETCSHEVLCVPNVPIFSYFLNPALCVIKNFIIK